MNNDLISSTVKRLSGETPETSIRHRGQELDILKSSVQSILRKNVYLHVYKVQLTQELKPMEQ